MRGEDKPNTKSGNLLTNFIEQDVSNLQTQNDATFGRIAETTQNTRPNLKTLFFLSGTKIFAERILQVY